MINSLVKRSRVLPLVCLLQVAGLALGFTARAEGQGPAVAAAASLRIALAEAAEGFRRETGLGVRLSFGSSGNFRRQIAQGAPFELFLSADEEYVFALQREGLTVGEGVVYAEGRLAYFVPATSMLTPDPDLKSLAGALEQGDPGRLAIANPEHAPYGRAARQALESAGLWEAVQPHLVLGENAAQAAQFAYSGSAAGGLLPYSLVLAPQVNGRGRFALVSGHRYEPVRQRMVLLRDAGDTARRFHAYLQSPAAREVLRRYGFLPAGGT